jgi:hypothetical protein
MMELRLIASCLLGLIAEGRFAEICQDLLGYFIVRP